MFSAARILASRKRKGWSQEMLAEHSGVSLRTIQRVEQGQTVPHGHTVQALAAALQVPLDMLCEEAGPESAGGNSAAQSAETLVPALPPPVGPAPAVLRADPDFVQLLNLSALGFLLLPLLNLLLPLLLWRARRHDTAHVAAVGRRVLGFQLLWQVGCFFAYMLVLAGQTALVRLGYAAPRGAFLVVFGVSYALNALTVVYYALQLRRGRLDIYRWRL